MAIDAKMNFLNQLSKELAGTLTVEQMKKLRHATLQVMDQFDMTELRMQEAGDDDLLTCYLRAMKVQSRSDGTIRRYEYVIRRMMDWVKVPTRRITVHHLRDYLATEQERGVKDSTLEGMRQIYSAYFNWLHREALIEKNPTANLGTIKVAKKEKKCYTESEMLLLIQNCEKVRDKAIVLFLRSTGCRVSEMTGLNREDVDLEKMECVVHGKGNKERTVYLSDAATMLLREYLRERTDNEPALFINRFHERLLPGGVREMLNRIAQAAGVEHVHPHKFRRTFATVVTLRGMPIQEAMRILGHEKVDTVMTYLVQNKDLTRADYRRYA